MIDPLEAVIAYLKSNATLQVLVGSQIADRQQYVPTGGWGRDTNAIVVRLDGGNPDWYVPWHHNVRLEVSCYAKTRDAAMDIDLAMLEISRTNERMAVSTSKGTALVYALLPDSGGSIVPDEDLQMERVLRFWKVMVSEIAIV